MHSDPAGLLLSADMLVSRLAQLAAGLRRKPRTEGHITAWAQPHSLSLFVPVASCVTLGESLHPLSLSFPGQVGITILLQGFYCKALSPWEERCTQARALSCCSMWALGHSFFANIEKLSLYKKNFFLEQLFFSCFLPDSGVSFPASSVLGLLC